MELVDVLDVVVLGIEQVDGFEIHRFTFQLLRDVLDVVPDRVDVLVRLAWVDSRWFVHCSATMLNIEELPFTCLCIFDCLVDVDIIPPAIDTA